MAAGAAIGVFAIAIVPIWSGLPTGSPPSQMLLVAAAGELFLWTRVLNLQGGIAQAWLAFVVGLVGRLPISPP